MQPGDIAVIHAGVYREHVRPGLNGTASAPITYQAAPGEEVVLTGADVLAGWTETRNGVWKKEQVSYHVHDVTVRRNICAVNRRYQIGLWWDNPFFGPHPTPSVGSQGTPLDPAQANLRFDENCYWMERKQQLALWGCPWRSGHLKYNDLTAWQTARGQDGHSLAIDPQFVGPSKDNWSLRPESPARKLGAGRSTETTSK